MIRFHGRSAVLVPTLSLVILACAGPAHRAVAESPAAKPSAAPAVSAAKAESTAVRPDSVLAKPYPVEVPTPPDSILVSLLRQGNFVLLVRHAATDWGQRDADIVNFGDRAAQRNLSEVGRAQADSIGKASKALGLKIGAVYASPMYRCRDTAEIAFGRADTTIDLFVKSKSSRDQRVKWLSTPLADGALLVLVSHQDPYIPLFRFQRDQLKEGDALLIRPDGSDKWTILAQLSPKDWARLASRYGR
ncbi:MAG TPA: histidine phosphatase family protein [Candidatus Eisenbacteria bacterium]|nr:histidine phosphatase family protein [Candidatus Eisenbacteria bacterium]